jgi:hypothetical protein
MMIVYVCLGGSHYYGSQPGQPVMVTAEGGKAMRGGSQ